VVEEWAAVVEWVAAAAGVRPAVAVVATGVVLSAPEVSAFVPDAVRR